MAETFPVIPIGFLLIRRSLIPASALRTPSGDVRSPFTFSLFKVPLTLPLNRNLVPAANFDRSTDAPGAKPLTNVPSPSVVNPRLSSLKSITMPLAIGSPDNLPSTVPETPLLASEKSKFLIAMSLTGPCTSASLRLITDFILSRAGAKYERLLKSTLVLNIPAVMTTSLMYFEKEETPAYSMEYSVMLMSDHLSWMCRLRIEVFPFSIVVLPDIARMS